MRDCRMHTVLIETLWNVKNGFRGIPVDSGGVLIETLWNVKCDRVRGMPRRPWF